MTLIEQIDAEIASSRWGQTTRTYEVHQEMPDIRTDFMLVERTHVEDNYYMFTDEAMYVSSFGHMVELSGTQYGGTHFRFKAITPELAALYNVDTAKEAWIATVEDEWGVYDGVEKKV
jgi:hypothetical protein